MGARTGGLYTREKFGDCQLHIEWSSPAEVRGNSQGRGNSGVLLMSRYEIQVLDMYNNPTYADGGRGVDLRPISAAGHRRPASPASGTSTTSFSRHPDSRASGW